MVMPMQFTTIAMSGGHGFKVVEVVPATANNSKLRIQRKVVVQYIPNINHIIMGEVICRINPANSDLFAGLSGS